MSEVMKNMPFNSGEVEVQKKLGVHEQVMSYAPRVIRNFMPDQHRAFFGQLPMIYTGWVDEKKGRGPLYCSENPGSSPRPTPRRSRSWRALLSAIRWSNI